jgi:hypothetical protein
MVIGLPLHGRQNSKKIGDEIPAPRSLLPAHILAFPRIRRGSFSDTGSQPEAGTEGP